MDEAALAERVANFDPTWESYQEEAKGYIGARPVAEWEGSAPQAHLAGDAIVVTFIIEGPWATRDFAMPILLRGPDLPARLAANARVDGDKTTYTFPLESSAILPWVEVQYPRGERRLTPRRTD